MVLIRRRQAAAPAALDGSDPPPGRPVRNRRALEFPARRPYLLANTIPDKAMARTNPLQFMQQVRAEVAKIVWPTRREVLLTTMMVFILAALAATFFSLVDLGIRTGLRLIFGA